MAKRITSFLLSLVLLATLCFGMAVPAGAVSFDGGDGSQDAPYLISTAAQFKAFRDLVNGGNSTICGKLTNNIDLKSEDWTPIGLDSKGYLGTFDGSGYAIKNLSITKASSGTTTGGWTLWGCGLFGIVGKSGVVRNLNVDGTISMNESRSKDIDIGGIAGGNLGTIEECFVTVSFEDFNLDITSPSSTSYTTIGGIAGVNSGTIRNCYVIGTFDLDIQTRKLMVGGLVGHAHSGKVTQENCYVVASFDVRTNAATWIGGLFGQIDGGTAKNLYANGDKYGSLSGNSSSAVSEKNNCKLLSTGEMKTTAFAQTLGSAFGADKNNVNQGYPILSVLTYDEEQDSSDWFQDEVSQEDFDRLTPPELQNKDLTRPITRAEFCAVAVQLYEETLGKTLSAQGLTTPFTDTSSDAVKKAYFLGITNGVSATAFDPYANISRESMATMLTRVYKALNLPGWSLDKDAQFQLDFTGVTLFADDQYISGYARPSVYFMVKNGVIKGVSATTFAPRNTTPYEEAIGYANATREAAIIMSVRMFNHTF